MHINSIPSQNQLTIRGVAHKLYIHTQALEFYQCGTNFTFIFQQARPKWQCIDMKSISKEIISKTSQGVMFWQLGAISSEGAPPMLELMVRELISC